jgi:hypothetical protein
MMRIFRVEYWSSEDRKYNQEYYKSISAAAQRMKYLDENWKDSNPVVETIMVDTDE